MKKKEDGTAQRLALIRKRLHGGISQRQSARLGVSAARYSNWENGHPIPTEQVKRITDITPGITGDWLYWGDIFGLTVRRFWELHSVLKDESSR